MSLSKACAALTRRAQDETRSPSCRLHSALAVCGSSSAPLNLALQAHATAALLLYRHTEQAALSVQQLQAALERCDAAPSHQTLPVVCAGAAVAQGLLLQGELQLARCHQARTPHNVARPPPPTSSPRIPRPRHRQLMEPLLAFLLQRPALVTGVDSSSDPYPLLCCHVHVLELLVRRPNLP